MRILLRGTTALALLTAIAGFSGVVKAADVVEAAPPEYSWSGFYIGGYVGAGALVAPTDVNILDVVLNNADGNGGDGVLGGAMAGYNLQVSDRVVLGLQGDIAFYDMDASDSFLGFEIGPDFVASASLRAGYLVTPETLFYVIGGYSYAEFNVDSTEGDDAFDDVSSDGFHVGFGMETRLTERLTARIEYRYSEFGGEDPLDIPDIDLDVKAHTHTGTLGLAYNLFPTAGEGEAASPAADVVEPMVSWTGLYIGLSGGAGAFVDEDPSEENDNVSVGGEGFLGSLFAGYNWQAGDRLVIGVEGAVGLSDMDWENDFDVPGVPLSEPTEAKLDWFASASLRAGWLVSPETMIYVIGGYSYAEFDIDTKIDILNGLVSLSDSSTESFDGFHVGAGIEAMLTDNLTARVEYRYTDYGQEHIDTFFFGELGLAPATHTGTIGISWLFNGS